MTSIRATLLNLVRRSLGYRFPPMGRIAFELAFKLAPRSICTELFPGIFANLDFSDEVQRATYWQGGRFEKPTLTVLDKWLNDGATVFFDIGSNYGFFSLALLSSHPALSAHAFEPNPVTFSHLAEIKKENRLDQLAIWNVGLGDKCAELPLRRGLSDSGHSTFGRHPDLATNDVVEVLDFETWQQRAGLSLPETENWVAKIDVEGFEMKVLLGLRHALKNRAFRGLVIEINEVTLGFCDSRPEQIYSYMDELGYKALTRSPGPDRQEFTANEFFVPR